MGGMPVPAGLLAAAMLSGQCEAPEARAEPPAISYVFAAELGSGIYDWGGRTLQIYRMPISWETRHAEPGVPGIRLRMPITAGFLEFKTSDIIELDLPDSVDLLTITPGLQLEFVPDPRWSIRPRAEAGLALMSAEDNALTAALGVDTDFTQPTAHGEFWWYNRLSYTHADYEDCLPNDDMGRLRSGVELRRPLPFRYGERQFQYGVFAFAEWYFDPPRIDTTSAGFERVQGEVGVMLGLVPMPDIFGITLPRLGLSYRFAGEFSGWRIVFGGPL